MAETDRRDLGNPEYWHRRYWEEELATKTDTLPFDAMTKDKMIRELAAKAADTYAVRSSLKGIFAKLQDWLQRTSADITSHLVWLMKATTGVELDPTVAKAIAEGSASPKDLKALNLSLQSFFGEIFNVAKASNDAASRISGEGSLDNLFNFMAFNVRVALSQQALSTLDTLFIGYLPNHLKEAGEDIIKSIGLQDAAEELFQALIDATITKGVEKLLFRQIQPNDLGSAEAVQANIEGRLSDEITENILLNEGIRKDVHALMKARAAKNLTQSDLQELFQRGAITEDDVFKAFRENTFAEPEARSKTDLIVNARQWDLQDEITKSYLRLFRDDVIAEGELRAWLGSQHFTAREADLAVQSELLKRRYRQWASLSDLDFALDTGLMVPADVAEYLRLQGMSAGDAALTVMRLAKPKLPKGKQDCFQRSAAGGVNALIAFIQQVLTSPEILLNVNFTTLLKCLEALLPLLELPEAPPEEEEEGVVSRPRITTFTIRPSSATAGELFAVEWETTGAETITIAPLFGEVAPSGALFSTLAESTIVTLSATGPGGSTTRTKAVAIKPEKPPKEEPVVRPEILSFSVSPGIVNVGDVVEVKWRVKNAEFVQLFPQNESVPSEGVRFATVDATTTFSIVATSPTGSDSRNDGVIVRPPKPEEPPAKKLPVIRVFNISPNRAVGEPPIVVSWRVDNADSVVIEPGIGAVPPEGSRIISATQSTTFRLTATNADGTDMRHETLVLVPKAAEKKEAKEPPAIAVFSLRPATISEPSDVEVQWRVERGDTVEITPRPGKVQAEGSVVVRVEKTETFQLVASNKDGSETRHDTILFVAPKPKEKKNGSQ